MALIRPAVAAILFLASAAGASLPSSASAQETGAIKSGEAFVTRFSGASKTGGESVIDLNGTVGSIVDLRSPSQPPQGQHWLNEPQRNPVTAAQVGQVFGVAIDDAKNIYLTATSAFGLHRTADNKNWMLGMWGPDGGPGTVWKIDAASGKPSLFARIGVDGRRNTGAALGNIAYDKWHHQLYVSDLETGLIHRLRVSDGADLGTFDQGVTGRASFLDVASGQKKSLPAIAFDPSTKARVDDCPTPFVKTPACWNFADFRRRVWGLGVRKDAKSGEVRLYYATWASEGFENPAFASAGDDEKHNAVWSVAIATDGAFDKASVRKEFVLPDFFTKPDDVARFGYSRPVADIAFCRCSEQNVMLLAERGGVRNLGLDDENAFAFPHQSRVLRYQIDKDGRWQVQGRYDVGYDDRKSDGPPYIRANASGGVDFGFAYGPDWKIDPQKPDGTAWMTGGSLCSPQAPCFSPDLGRNEDGSYVAGAQGTPVFAYSDLCRRRRPSPIPRTGPATPATGPRQSYLFDTDINVDADNNVVAGELTRNDATKVGDIAIFQDCAETAPPPRTGRGAGRHRGAADRRRSAGRHRCAGPGEGQDRAGAVRRGRHLHLHHHHHQPRARACGPARCGRWTRCRRARRCSITRRSRNGSARRPAVRRPACTTGSRSIRARRCRSAWTCNWPSASPVRSTIASRTSGCRIGILTIRPSSWCSSRPWPASAM